MTFALLASVCCHASSDAQQRPPLPAGAISVQSEGPEDRASLNADRDRQLESLQAEWQRRFDKIQSDAQKDLARLKKQGYTSKDATAINQRRQKSINELNREYGERRAEIYRRWSAAGQALANRNLSAIDTGPILQRPDSSPLDAEAIRLPGSDNRNAGRAEDLPDGEAAELASVNSPEAGSEEQESTPAEPRDGPLRYRLGTTFAMTGRGSYDSTSWEPLHVRLPVQFRMTGLGNAPTREYEPIRHRVDTTFTMTGRERETP